MAVCQVAHDWFNTGGASRLIFKMFRKTKQMSGVKDLRDNSDQRILLMVRLTSGSLTLLIWVHVLSAVLQCQYFAHCPSPEITVRMSLYVTMFFS